MFVAILTSHNYLKRQRQTSLNQVWINGPMQKNCITRGERYNLEYHYSESSWETKIILPLPSFRLTIWVIIILNMNISAQNENCRAYWITIYFKVFWNVICVKRYLTPPSPFPVNTVTRIDLSKNINGDEFLNIFTLNIRSLPKHGGELYVYLESLHRNFDVIILIEKGARNLSVVQKLLPNFTFFIHRLSTTIVVL